MTYYTRIMYWDDGLRHTTFFKSFDGKIVETSPATREWLGKHVEHFVATLGDRLIRRFEYSEPEWKRLIGQSIARSIENN